MTVCVYQTVLLVLSYPHISVTASDEFSSRVGANNQEKDNNERSSGKEIGPPWI